MFQDIGFLVHDVMIYQKKNTPFMRSNAYTNCWEFMFVLSKGGPPKTFNPLKTPTVRNGEEMLTFNKRPDGINRKRKAVLKEEKTRTNIWAYTVGNGGATKDKIAFQHPAVFPEKLAAEHILSWSNEGDVVLDPMCGSGTTCKNGHVARPALRGNRHLRGIRRDRPATATGCGAGDGVAPGIGVKRYPAKDCVICPQGRPSIRGPLSSVGSEPEGVSVTVPQPTFRQVYGHRAD